MRDGKAATSDEWKEAKKMRREGNERGRRARYGGWGVVCALALAFLLYGLLMFFVVGDKGPPDWDFGSVEDVPGQSVYSTSPSDPGTTGLPEPQHVSERPSGAMAGTSDRGATDGK